MGVFYLVSALVLRNKVLNFGEAVLQARKIASLILRIYGCRLTIRNSSK